jgi:dolichyl-phosphate-mannose--protein O-mannosyl transferase
MKDGLMNGKTHLVVLSVFIMALILRIYGISDQPPISDEVASAYAAENYIRHGIFGQVMWYHPQLRNLIIFFTSRLSGGYDVWGLKSASILLGSLTVLVTGYLAFMLTGSTMVAGLAAFFLAIDPLHIGLSREAFQEAMTPFFILSGVVASMAGLKKKRYALHYLAGLTFGLAASLKWHGLFPWAVMGGMYFMDLILNWRERSLKDWVVLVNAYLLIPVLIYVLTYLPWILKGHDLGEFARFQLFLLKRQFYHHGPPYAEIFLYHRAYSWFLWPVAWVDFVFLNGKPYLNIATGNFLVWGLTLPSLVYVSIRSWKQRDSDSALLVLLFLMSYLPLVLTSRGVWVFSAPAVIPFAFLLTAWTIWDLLKKEKLSKGIVVLYLFIVTVVSAFMYPMVTFKAFDYSYLKPVAEIYNPHGRQWNIER